MPEPLVSIVIPVFNGEHFLQEAIESALAQDYQNLEVLVVNDGSIDGSREIALAYGNKIRYFEKPNGGVASALNLAIDEMKGEYFSWLSHDDLYRHDKISTQISVIRGQAEPTKCIVYSNYEVHDVRSKKLLLYSELEDFDFERGQFAIATSNNIHGCSLLIPKSAFDVAGKFDTSLRHTQDYEMWFRLAKLYRFILVRDCLVVSRIHPSQCSRQSPLRRIWENDRVIVALLRKVIHDEKVRGDLRGKEWRQLSRAFWGRRMPGSSMYALWRSFVSGPS